MKNIIVLNTVVENILGLSRAAKLQDKKKLLVGFSLNPAKSVPCIMREKHGNLVPDP